MKLKDLFSLKNIMGASVESLIGLVLVGAGIYMCVERDEYANGSAMIALGMTLLPFKFPGKGTPQQNETGA